MIRTCALLVAISMSGGLAYAETVFANGLPRDPEVILATAAQEAEQEITTLQNRHGGVGLLSGLLVPGPQLYVDWPTNEGVILRGQLEVIGFYSGEYGTWVWARDDVNLREQRRMFSAQLNDAARAEPLRPLMASPQVVTLDGAARLANIATLMQGVDAIWATRFEKTTVFFAVFDITPRSTP